MDTSENSSSDRHETNPSNADDDDNPFPFSDVLEDDFAHLWTSNADHPCPLPLQQPIFPRPVGGIYHDLHGQKIIGGPLFEMYYVKINYLTPDHYGKPFIFFTRSSTSNNKEETIYKCIDGADVPLETRLPIKGPRRPPDPQFDVYFGVFNPDLNKYVIGWGCSYQHRSSLKKYGEPIVHPCFDYNEPPFNSRAEVCYEIYENAAIAQLRFIFEFDDGNMLDGDGDIVIQSGNMFVTTNGNPETKRYITNFSESRKVELGKLLPVDRFAFGVPMDSELHISVDLTCQLGEAALFDVQGCQKISVPDVITPYVKVPFDVQGCQKISVPDVITPDAKGFDSPLRFLKLSMVINWSDPCFDSIFYY